MFGGSIPAIDLREILIRQTRVVGPKIEKSSCFTHNSVCQIDEDKRISSYIMVDEL